MTRCICSTAYLSFKKANSHHGRPCKLDLQQNSTISFYSSSPNRKKSIQHFLLSLSGYCPNSFWKQSSVNRFLRKQGRDAHRRCCRPYGPGNSPRDHWIARTSTVRRIPSTPKTTKTTSRFYNYPCCLWHFSPSMRLKQREHRLDLTNRNHRLAMRLVHPALPKPYNRPNFAGCPTTDLMQEDTSR